MAEKMVIEEEKMELKKELDKRIKNLNLESDAKEELLKKFLEWYDVGFLCYYCGVVMELKFGTDLSFSIDHVIPRSHGGRDTIDNLKFVCWRCNMTKKDKGVDWFMRNLRLLQERRRKKIRTIEFSKAIKSSIKDKRVQESYQEIFEHIEANR
ncbi:HNH endonuclease [candidate division WOR-3 bacterium]|nr:HNH endonuclease [candidate division WOR-3 bacterium]